jgi:cytochrome c peroxidase
MRSVLCSAAGVLFAAVLVSTTGQAAGPSKDGKFLFDKETFGGNGRTCRTCHSEVTGTVSPQDAAKRLKKDPQDPLFRHDGSDDGLGTGTTRILKDATVLITIPLAPNVTLADDPAARSVVLRRGIATTLNTPALDPILMLDGRQPTLDAQAAGAIHDHAQGVGPSAADLHLIAQFQTTNAFFSSPAMLSFFRGGAAPGLPQGITPSEKRGRRFFEDEAPNPAEGFKPGLCAHCHSGPLMNQTNEFAKDFIGLPLEAGLRFMGVAVSEFNAAGNPARTFVFNAGTPQESRVVSPDPGRALITGISPVVAGPADAALQLQNVNAFKISPLRGIRLTAPYFHDNSAKTLEDVAAHYTLFFNIVTAGGIALTPQDQKDMVAFMKLLD